MWLVLLKQLAVPKVSASPESTGCSPARSSKSSLQLTAVLESSIYKFYQFRILLDGFRRHKNGENKLISTSFNFVKIFL
jgi:hypothetical protein